MNNAPSTCSNGLRAIIALLFATTLTGCVSLEMRLGQRPRRNCAACYNSPDCFGFRSTCWQKWPEHCTTCPSPFAPLAPIIDPNEPLPANQPNPDGNQSSRPDSALPDWDPMPELKPMPTPTIEPVAPSAPMPADLPELSPVPE